MTPGDVYQTLTTRHPSAESRRYLYKVNTAQKILPPPIIPLTAPDDAQGKMLSTSQFRFANWECLQLFATGNKTSPRS